MPVGVAHNHSPSPALSNSITYTGHVGNSLLVWANVTGTSQTFGSISDTAGNVWVPVFALASGSSTAYLVAYYCAALVSGTATTITMSWTVSAPSCIYVGEYTPLGVFDKASAIKGASSAAVTSNSVTPAATGETAIALVGDAGFSPITISSWTGGFAQADSFNGAPSGGWADQVLASSSPVSAGVTLNTSTNWSCVVLLFKSGSTPNFNSYSNLLAISDGFNYDSEVWWCSNVYVSSAPFTVTLATNVTSNKSLAAAVFEVSGLTLVDQKSSTKIVSGTSLVVTNPGANTGVNDFVAAGIFTQFGISALSDPPASGYTSAYTNPTVIDIGYRLDGSALTDSASWTWTGSGNAGGVLASFKSAGASVVQVLPLHTSGTELVGTFVSPPTVGNALVIVCGLAGGNSGFSYNSIFDNQSASPSGVPTLLLLGVG